MRILAVSDLRTQSLFDLATVIKGAKPDLVVYAGDDVLRLGGVPDRVHIDRGVEALEQKLAHLGRGSWHPDAGEGTLHCGPLPGSAEIGAVRVDICVAVDVVVQAERLDGAPTQNPARGDTLRKSHPRRFARLVADSWWEFRVAAKPPPPPRPFLDVIQEVPHGLAGVLGNDCRPEHRAVLEQPGFHDLHTRPLFIDGIAMLGLEGSPVDHPVGYLLRDEEETRLHLKRQLQAAKGHPAMLVSHAPPRGVLDLALRFGVEHIGCKVVREHLDSGSFAGVICGHVHRCGGKLRAIGGAPVINIASHDDPLSPIEAALIEVGTSGVERVSLKTFHRNRRLASSLPGVGKAGFSLLVKRDLRTVKDVAKASLDELRGPLKGRSRSIQRHAWARVRGTPIVDPEARPLSSPLLHLDAEYAGEGGDCPWLIGLLPPDEETVLQHVEMRPDKQGDLIEWLDATLEKHSDGLLTTWGPHDRVVLLKACTRLGISPPEWLELEVYWLDLCTEIKRRIALPTRGYTLEEVARLFGFRWSVPELDGYIVGTMYNELLSNGRELPLEMVKAYNVDDVRAMAVVEAECRSLLQRAGIAEERPSDELSKTSSSQLSLWS